MARSKLRTSIEAYKVSRKMVQERAQGRCEAVLAPRMTGCSGYGSMAHHIIPRSRGIDHSPGNLMWVSAKCHAHIHDNPKWATEVGYLKSAPPVETIGMWE